MPAGSARLSFCAVLLLGVASRLSADDHPAGEKLDKPAQASTAPAAPAPAAVELSVDLTKARAEVKSKLEELEKVAEKDQTPTQKSLREIWNQRGKCLDVWENAAKERKLAENPVPTPESEANDLKADLVKRRAMIDQLQKSPETILPEVFRLDAEKIDEAKTAEMGEKIEDLRRKLKDITAESEKAKAEAPDRAKKLEELRTKRDRLHAMTTTSPARLAKCEVECTSATTPDGRRIARESLINCQCEAASEYEQLAAAVAALSLETRRAKAIDLGLENQETQLELLQRFLTLESKRFAFVAEVKKKALQTEAAREQTRAATVDDPLEKFKSLRNAEILSLEAQNVEFNNVYKTSPMLSEGEQRDLADKAEKDFANLKKTVSQNRVGGLVALRLNNDFRRISRERASIQRNEFAQSSSTTAYYENVLTEAELSFFNDSRDDRSERDTFLETLPAWRRADASAAIDEIERKHKKQLAARKAILELLLNRALETHSEICRRIRILDEQYAFVRTNIFWVRDSEPIGEATFPQARSEARRILGAGVRLAAEPFDASRWTRPSGEFGLIAAGLAVFPLVIPYSRRRLKALLS
jgi:hypothetical protein